MVTHLNAARFTLSSLDFSNNNKGMIPKEFTLEGANKIPRLAWEYPPENAKSFALIVDDPDAPKPDTPWVHWVVWDIPASKRSTDYITTKDEQLPDGTMQGKNSWSHVGYNGPMPPKGHGIHHYHFKIYALDVPKLNLKPGATAKQVEKAMKGHVLGQAERIGLYERK